MISTKSKHIETLTFKIEMKEDAKTDLHDKYQEVFDDLNKANKDLESFKRAKEDAARLVNVASQENCALAMLIELADSITRPTNTKPFSAGHLTLKNVQTVMKVTDWETIEAMKKRKNSLTSESWTTLVS
jgi:hypothetical protein